MKKLKLSIKQIFFNFFEKKNHDSLQLGLWRCYFAGLSRKLHRVCWVTTEGFEIGRIRELEESSLYE